MKETRLGISFSKAVNNTGYITIRAPSAEDAYDENQRFVFAVYAEPLDGSPYTLTLSLMAGEEITLSGLSAGTYTVTQQTPWSWRYKLDGVTESGGSDETAVADGISFKLMCLSADDGVSVTFANSLESNKWLSHNSPVETNTAGTATVAALDLAEFKRGYTL